MVAYSFKKRFVDPIRVGLSSVSLTFDCPPKRQTIRAIGKRRHARPGETLQLYTAMRTRQCALIGLAECESVSNVVIWLAPARDLVIQLDGKILGPVRIQKFATSDGFDDWQDMREFWIKEHKITGDYKFDGVCIMWKPIS